jgi:hypothetical protein
MANSHVHSSVHFFHNILNHFYFPGAFLQVKKLMEKTYSETEQNMSEKQGKGQIMLHIFFNLAAFWR